MKIEVTEDHISRGIPDMPGCCPVALALTETVGSPAYLHIECIHFPEMDDLCFKVPKSVEYFASSFDKGYAVKPFSFELNL